MVEKAGMSFVRLSRFFSRGLFANAVASWHCLSAGYADVHCTGGKRWLDACGPEHEQVIQEHLSNRRRFARWACVVFPRLYVVIRQWV